MAMEVVGTVLTFLAANSTAVLASLVIVLFFILKSQKYDYWEKQGVNGPKPLPLIGNAWELVFKSVYEINKSRYKQYGRIFGFYEKSTPVLSVAEPELLRCILVKDNDSFFNRRPSPSVSPYLNTMLTALRDDKWKRVRSILSPTFTSGKMKKMSSIIDECVSRMLATIRKHVDDNQEIDVKHVYGAFTMDVISLCAFATKTNAYNNPNDPFVQNASAFVRFQNWRLAALMLLPKFVRQAIDFNPQPSSLIAFFRDTIKEIIKQRMTKNVKVNDLLQLLLDAEKSDNLAAEIKDINSEQLSSESQEDIAKNAKLLSSNHGDVKLSDEEVIAQSMIFFVAGYETTASLLSYASYCLALNPDKQDLLFKEVKQHFDVDKCFEYDTVNRMKYLNAVLSETLRMYPPAVRLERQVTKEYRLPNTDITVPKGSLVQAPIYDIHHDKENFPDPEAFKPERFLPENINDIKPYTYLPFGSGPRNCIGMRFALMEAKIALANLILNYKMVPSESTDIPLKMVALPIALLPVDRVILKMEKR